jgi:hypothetical protein
MAEVEVDGNVEKGKEIGGRGGGAMHLIFGGLFAIAEKIHNVFA